MTLQLTCDSTKLTLTALAILVVEPLSCCPCLVLQKEGVGWGAGGIEVTEGKEQVETGVASCKCFSAFNPVSNQVRSTYIYTYKYPTCMAHFMRELNSS